MNGFGVTVAISYKKNIIGKSDGTPHDTLKAFLDALTSYKL